MLGDDIVDFILNPVVLFVGGVALTIGLIWWAISSENAEIAGFKQRCVAAGETAAKCDVLAEIKRSADDAATTAAFAVGFSAGRR